MGDIRAMCRKAFPVIFILIWLANLAVTDAYFSVYCIIAFLSFYLLIKNLQSVELEVNSRPVLVGCLSFVFSVLVLLANYELFTQIGDPALIGRSTSLLMNVINAVLSFIGGICVAYPIFKYVFGRFPVAHHSSLDVKRPRRLAVLIFGSIVCINLIHLFLVEYPGNVTEDPFTQISEMVSGKYSNFNTYWHTILLRSILSLGYVLFSDINGAVSLFCVIQTLIMACAFTHCIMTMVHYGIPKPILLITYLIYALIPYNMALCITIWKDVLFAAGCLLMLSAWVRIMRKIGDNSLWNYLVFAFGSLLFLLSRTNGWIIYLVTFLITFVFIRKDKKFSIVMCIMAVLGWFLLNPMLSILNVSGGDLAESLSIPIQQVSRVIADGCELTEEEENLLSRVVDLEEVPELYTDWLSDPMKVELRSKDYNYFQEHISDYTKMWVRLGMKYPWEYVKAWVDQTKGYWNAGYDYALYSETVTDNPYGVQKTGGGNPIASLFRLYFGLSRHLIFFEPLHSIGLHVWIMIFCFLLNLVRKRAEWVLSVPMLLLVVGLWFGTPVYCCFRYVYPLFVSFPLLVSTALCSSEKK